MTEDLSDIRGQGAGDYFNILCPKCGQGADGPFITGGYTETEYYGKDSGGTPTIKVTCKKCGLSGIWKVTWRGLPPKPYKYGED